jgi:hypothetical protein
VATGGSPSAESEIQLVEKWPIMRWLNWIWHIRGSVELAPGQSSDEAFDRLAPLFRQTGTSHERTDDTLTFHKKDPAAQDKMSIFDGGVLRVERQASGPVLRYHMISRALLFCFMLPPLFIGIAQLTMVVAKAPEPETGAAAGKPSDASKKPVAKVAAKTEADKAAPAPMNPIDKFLGAPAPEKPKKAEDKPARRSRKPSPTAAYVFAGIFAALYVGGRILEDRLIKRLFRKTLTGS